jgi:hypothetical protein
MAGCRALRAALAGACVVFGLSGVCAAEQPASGGLVRFSGAMVAQYDVTLAGPPVEMREVGLTRGVRETSTVVTFDAHDRPLPGARIVLADGNGVSLAQHVEPAVRATWRDAASQRVVPPRPDGAYRVGPYGGAMTIAAPDADAAGPIVMKIFHP